MLGVFSANINMSIGIIGRIKTSEKKTDRQVVLVCHIPIPVFINHVYTLTHQLFVLCVFLRGKRKRKVDKKQIWKKNHPYMLSVMLPYDFFMKVSKILCPVMLCLWWHELKSKILWYIMLVLFLSKILWFLMKLTIWSDFPGVLFFKVRNWKN